MSTTAVQTVQCWDNRARIQIDAVETGGAVEYRSTEADGLAITCPNGATETYSEAEVDSQPPSCGGFSAGKVCTFGDCP